MVHWFKKVTEKGLYFTSIVQTSYYLTNKPEADGALILPLAPFYRYTKLFCIEF